jgi:CubicO group peptidase (beta-lactamase class C family)
VREAFRRNLEARRELGAACALVHRGRAVVDLWGGVRDAGTGVPWERDTLVLVYSVTKGIAAAALAVLHARGLLDPDARVAEAWPGFARAGKEGITIRQLLAHEAGLCAVDVPLDPTSIADRERLVAILERQAPAWEPGARHAYHAISLGFYVGELLRRLDPRGRSLGAFVREELAAPLGTELFVGLPADLPEGRTARSPGRAR